MIFIKKEYRVKKSREIEKIIKQKNSVGNRYLVVYKNKNHDFTHFRYAVSVSKKFGNAVMRNKIKRRIREIIKDLTIQNDFDIFIVIKVPANKLSFSELKENLIKLLSKNKLM